MKYQNFRNSVGGILTLTMLSLGIGCATPKLQSNLTQMKPGKIESSLKKSVDNWAYIDGRLYGGIKWPNNKTAYIISDENGDEINLNKNNALPYSFIPYENSRDLREGKIITFYTNPNNEERYFAVNIYKDKKGDFQINDAEITKSTRMRYKRKQLNTKIEKNGLVARLTTERICEENNSVKLFKPNQADPEYELMVLGLKKPVFNNLKGKGVKLKEVLFDPVKNSFRVESIRSGRNPECNNLIEKTYYSYSGEVYALIPGEFKDKPKEEKTRTTVPIVDFQHEPNQDPNTTLKKNLGLIIQPIILKTTPKVPKKSEQGKPIYPDYGKTVLPKKPKANEHEIPNEDHIIVNEMILQKPKGVPDK